MAHPDIEAWFKNAVGREMNYDHAYGLQCVDAVDTYAQDIFGIPWQQCVGGVGGAKELLDVVPDAYWIRIDNNPYDANLIPQRGDVLVWGGVPTVNPFGHTAICLSADVNGVNVLQQDGFAPPLQWVNNNWYSKKPAHTAWLGYDNPGTGMMTGWLRPRPEKLRKIVGNASTNIEAPAKAPAKPIIKPPAKSTGGFLMALSDEKQEELYQMVKNLHDDYRQGIPGVQSDGDSFHILRRLAAGAGIMINETARRTKWHGVRKYIGTK